MPLTTIPRYNPVRGEPMIVMSAFIGRDGSRTSRWRRRLLALSESLTTALIPELLGKLPDPQLLKLHRLDMLLLIQ